MFIDYESHTAECSDIDDAGKDTAMEMLGVLLMLMAGFSVLVIVLMAWWALS